MRPSLFGRSVMRLLYVVPIGAIWALAAIGSRSGHTSKGSLGSELGSELGSVRPPHDLGGSADSDLGQMITETEVMLQG
jgi:hypothetical protein